MLRARRAAFYGLPLLVAASCSDQPSRPAAVGLSMKAPAGILDTVDSVTLFVAAEGDGFTCDPASGNTSSPFAGRGDLKTFPLHTGGCPSGGVWCGDITLPNDPATKQVFGVEAKKGSDVLGSGCASAAVNSDPFNVSITIKKYVPPAVCGNGAVEVGEECDEAAGEVCDSTCHTVEQLLSADFGPITNDPVGSKKQVASIFENDPTNVNPNPFRAVFTDTGASGGAEINFRQMSQRLESITTPAAIAGMTPLPCAGVANPGNCSRQLTQQAPSVAALSDQSFVAVFEDYRVSGPSISLSPINPNTSAAADHQRINVGGTAAAHTPAVAAGPAGTALVVWADSALGKVVGRIYDHASDSLKPAADIVIGSQAGDAPKVAGSATGWVVAWHGVGSGDADDIVMANVDPSGAVSGEATVNTGGGTQDQPAVAMQDDGSFAVVWRDGASIRLQRYAAGAAVAGDQDNPVNDQGGTASLPAIAAGKNGPAGFYGVAWGTDSGEIHARFPGAASGWFYNLSTGQSSEFVASRAGVTGQRSAPSIAIGGAGVVAVSWQDDGSGPQHGIVARRLPLPTAN